MFVSLHQNGKMCEDIKEMKITDVQCYPYRIPLRNSFTTAHHELHTRDGALVEIHTEEGITGVGEMAPLPEFGGGSLDAALASLPAIVTRLRGKQLDEALDLLSREMGSLPASTTCALEIALLDALGKTRQCAVSNLLGTHPRPSIRVNAVVGVQTAEAAAKRAQEAVRAGFGCIKLKVGISGQSDIERVAAVREAIGPTIHLRLDANEAWNFEQACTILTHCARFDIQYVEQPLPASDLEGMRKLRQVVSIPIAADEMLSHLESARTVLAARAADVLIIKPQLAGGLRVGRQIIQEAAAQGIQSVVTSTIEAGIGLVAALHLAAASTEVILECGFATLHLLEDDLIVEDLPIHNGLLTVPTGPGLGIQLDRTTLEKYVSGKHC